ncbi:MAG: glycosyltransferase family 2 protein [Bacteroidales bacterium]|nr:glycosyltransferase family 2 protein [Bacteroidales bacterium]
MKKKISVIIPTYNRALYLTKAVDSVLEQTYRNYEIIVVDDGSTDNTKEVLLPYRDKIRYIYQDNKGVSTARNTGILKANGELIAFLDSDDEWFPDKLKIQVSDFELFPDAVLSCTNAIIETADKEKVDFFRDCHFLHLEQSQSFYKPSFKSFVITPTALVMRSALFKVGMFDERLSIYEDLDLFFRMFTLGHIIINPIRLVKVYRREEPHNLNLTSQSNNKEKCLDNLLCIYQKLLKYDLTVPQRKYAKNQLSATWFDFGLYYNSLNKSKQANECFSTSFLTLPNLKNLIKMVIAKSGRSGNDFFSNRRKKQKVFRRSEL